jgi:hypothetical protein
MVYLFSLSLSLSIPYSLKEKYNGLAQEKDRKNKKRDKQIPSAVGLPL